MSVESLTAVVVPPSFPAQDGFGRKGEGMMMREADRSMGVLLVKN